MKKIFLLFAAAVAVLSSCVKENGLEPQVNTDGKVTINAVAVDSKTVLDGLNVVWENEDALSVVLAGDVTSVAEFSAESVDGAEAKFVYAGTEALALEDATSAYAVYPASAVSQEGGVVKISHTLPEVQTGVVESGMNLSSAALSVEELVAGQATAQFKNALALLQVVVPAGVSKVSLHTTTGSALVGDMTFNVVDGALTVASTGTKRTVTLSTGSELAEGTHNLLVYPGYAPTLTLTMTATDGAVYESTVQHVTFAAGEARKIDLTKIFNLDSRELYVVLPAGETFEVPVVTTDHYQYEVSCTADWVTYEVPTKGFHKETITFTVAQNTTGADREAEVTISWGDRTKSFTIQQKNIFMDFVNDANGEPIQWEETFSIYSTQESAVAGTNAEKTYNNVFTIALSDDYSKGTYKVTNIFKTDKIWQDGYISNEGGIYYADYADNKLTIKMEGARKSYFFGSNVVLIYNSTDKTFVLEQPAAFGMNQNSSYNKAGFIGSYTAAVKVDEPAVDVDPALAAFVGTWTETYVNKPYSWSTEKVYEGEFTVSVVDGKLYFENIFVSSYGAGKYYGTLSADGTTISLEDAEEYGHPEYGPLSYNGPVDLVVEGNTLKVSSAFNGAVANYVATKQVDPLEALVGTWAETYVNKPYSWSTEKVYEGEFTVSVVDGKLYFENIFVSSYGAGKYYGTLSADGTTISLEDAEEYGHPEYGPLSYNGPVDLVVEGNTLKVSSAFNGAVANYVATKK